MSPAPAVRPTGIFPGVPAGQSTTAHRPIDPNYKPFQTPWHVHNKENRGAFLQNQTNPLYLILRKMRFFKFQNNCSKLEKMNGVTYYAFGQRVIQLNSLVCTLIVTLLGIII